ncbi:MAG: biopolymer transport protein ExbB, partial [bacterium]
MLEQIQVIIDKGGIMMIPLGICSFLTVFITLEKIFFLRKGRLLAPSYLKQWNDFFSENQSKSKVNKNAPAILHQVFLPLVDALPMPHERLEERIADLSRKQKHQLERGMVFLETIAGIAPLFGLLGTALGMVE